MRPQIFTPARKLLSLTIAASIGNGALLTTFFKRWSKISLKCNKEAFITSELGGLA